MRCYKTTLHSLVGKDVNNENVWKIKQPSMFEQQEQAQQTNKSYDNQSGH